MYKRRYFIHACASTDHLTPPRQTASRNAATRLCSPRHYFPGLTTCKAAGKAKEAQLSRSRPNQNHHSHGHSHSRRRDLISPCLVPFLDSLPTRQVPSASPPASPPGESQSQPVPSCLFVTACCFLLFPLARLIISTTHLLFRPLLVHPSSTTPSTTWARSASTRRPRTCAQFARPPTLYFHF